MQRRTSFTVAGLAATSVMLLGLLGLGAPASASGGDQVEMVFPVAGAAGYHNDFGAPRNGGRTHEGNDIFGGKGQVLLAAADGKVTWLRDDSAGNAGNALGIRAENGWSFRYMHINNDTPGTDDGANRRHHAFVAGIRSGVYVVAGQPIAFMGDSGNAEGTPPHVHFETRRPDGSAANPYVSLRSARRAVAPAGRAVAANPKRGFYVLTADGKVHAYDGAPYLGSPALPAPLARSIAVTPDGGGYVVLDAWGGLHRFGTAATGPVRHLRGPYFKGRDLARDVAITPSGKGLVVLDAWGGVHRSGDAPAAAGAHWWPGWDIARAVAVTPSGTGLYVLDGFGGVHASGDAVRDRTPYWRGWDMARDLAAVDDGYAVLDGWGGVHTAGEAERPDGSVWSRGSDWRGLAARGSRYVTVRHDGLTVKN